MMPDPSAIYDVFDGFRDANCGGDKMVVTSIKGATVRLATLTFVCIVDFEVRDNDAAAMH